MAGATMTFAYDDVGTVKKIIIDWLSDDATADVVGTTKKISGFLLKGVTDPDVNAPDDNYNIILTDEEGSNILLNCNDDLLLRDTANIESVDFVIRDIAVAGQASGAGERPCASDMITVSIDSAGNANEGRLVLYWMGSV